MATSMGYTIKFSGNIFSNLRLLVNLVIIFSHVMYNDMYIVKYWVTFCTIAKGGKNSYFPIVNYYFSMPIL